MKKKNFTKEEEREIISRIDKYIMTNFSGRYIKNLPPLLRIESLIREYKGALDAIKRDPYL